MANNLQNKYPEIYQEIRELISGAIFSENDMFGGGGRVVKSDAYCDEYDFLPAEPVCMEAVCYNAIPPKDGIDKGNVDSISPNVGIDFEELVKDKKKFTDALMEHINASRMTNAEIYNAANMSRQSYSKIIYGDVVPKKTSVLALAIALKLSIDDTEDLLARAGHSFVEADIADTIVKYFITKKMYDIYIINEFLDYYHQKLLGNVIA